MIRFTVATVCFNAATTLRRTLDSVLVQQYPHIEHLIIDGASTDDTRRLVDEYATLYRGITDGRSLVFRSEPDKGLYDAMNKALRQAGGDYILFLNAGDKFHATTTLSDIASQLSAFADPAQLPAVLYGDTHLVDDRGTFLRARRLSPPEQLRRHDFVNGMLVCHQAFFARTDLARATPYDLRYRFSADYDWCIRLMQQAEQRRLPLFNTHTVVADYLSEGLTTRHHKASLRERFRIMVHHYGLFSALAHHAWFVIRALIKR